MLALRLRDDTSGWRLRGDGHTDTTPARPLPAVPCPSGGSTVPSSGRIPAAGAAAGQMFCPTAPEGCPAWRGELRSSPPAMGALSWGGGSQLC